MVRHLWVWEFAGLWPGGQKGGPGATRGGASVYGFERGGDVGPLRRRVHDGGGDAAVSALLQGRMVGIREPWQRRGQQYVGREVSGGAGREARGWDGEVGLRDGAELGNSEEHDRAH